MKASIWMPLYIGDYMGDTMHLSTEQHGAYLLLMFAYWRNGGPLPDDAEYLAGVARLSADAWQRHSKRMAEFFQIDGGLWRHHRLDEEIARATRQKMAQINAGRAGALARYGKRMAEAQQPHSGAIAEAQRKHSSSPSPSPIAEREQSNPERPSLAEVLAYADRNGGPTEWKVRDWFNEMEACGWLDHNHRPVVKWQPLLNRVKVKWESDGRPSAPPSNRGAQGNRPPVPPPNVLEGIPSL